MIRVLLADDHGIVRTILRQILEKTEDIQVVSTASNGQEAVYEAVAHYPNVAVMDVSMPRMDGVEATKQIRAKCPKTRVLMVSTYDTPYHIHRSIEAGAFGYILKDVVNRDLVIAVRTIYEGKQYFSQRVVQLI